MTLPAEQLTDAHQLEADGIVYLYEMTPVSGGTIRFKSDDSVTWQGHSYTGTAVAIDDKVQSTDGQLSRPKMTLANPLAVYSSLVAAGNLDNAVIVEKRVLRGHLDANSNIFSQRTWKVRRVPNLDRNTVVLELRDSLDGQKFLLPARQFMPPDFPTVTI